MPKNSRATAKIAFPTARDTVGIGIQITNKAPPAMVIESKIAIDGQTTSAPSSIKVQTDIATTAFRKLSTAGFMLGPAGLVILSSGQLYSQSKIDSAMLRLAAYRDGTLDGAFDLHDLSSLPRFISQLILTCRTQNQLVWALDCVQEETRSNK
jgi:hypothetical protein